MSKIISYIFKNLALMLGILEAILKVVSGIVSMTPTKRDDALVDMIDNGFSAIKKVLYTVADKLAGKDPTIPNS